MPFPRRSAARRGRRVALAALVLAPALALSLAACSDEANPLAPYLGQRPLEFLKVTQNFTPQIQWVGGRVAAVGINRGDRAALDSTLVWIQRAPDNSISSVVTVGPELDRAFVESFGGTPQEEMVDGETYTFWIAEASVFHGGLDRSLAQSGAFADTTLTLKLILRGTPRSTMGVVFTIQRDEWITEDRYLLSWTPEHIGFRRLVINQGTVGSWMNHLWHIVVPDDQPASISSPVAIGVPPESAQQATEWPEEGFMTLPPCPSRRRSYVLWAATDEWNETFTATAPGYAQFLIDFRNFPEVDPNLDPRGC
jgi:hypothetical protein